MKSLLTTIALTFALPLSAIAFPFAPNSFIPCLNEDIKVVSSTEGNSFCVSRNTRMRYLATSNASGEVSSMISGEYFRDGFFITYGSANLNRPNVSVVFDAYGKNTGLSGEFFPPDMPDVDLAALEAIYDSFFVN